VGETESERQAYDILYHIELQSRNLSFILVFTNKQSIIAMAGRYSIRSGSDLKPNPICPIEQQINILLLGPTGVCKTTFINAFANDIVHNTLEQADEDEIQIIIPSSFAFTMPDTFTEKRITLGNENDHEKFVEVSFFQLVIEF
jgi:DNA replication protein DnaC